MSGAAFSGQTKSKLTSNVSAALEQELLPALTTFFAKNQSLARSIIRRAAAVKKSKDEFTKTLKTMSDAKRKSKNSMPSGLVQAPRASALTRELYIVEGDSAGGCHFSDVEVLLANGSTKSFAALVDDERHGIKNLGIAFDLSTGQPEVFEFVEPRIVKTVTEYAEVALADGTVWRGTVDHPWLLTDGTYKAAGDLTPEDDVQEVQHLPNLGQSLGS
jgi:DNA gyrase subunit B